MAHPLDSRRRPAHRPLPADRDAALDAARTACLIAVVMIHILLVTLTADPATGALTNVMAPTAAVWYPPVSWLAQVMPLFFVVGGCASAISWTRRASAGRSGPAWVRARLLRLVLPAAVLWAVLALAGVAATATGVPTDWVSLALQGLGMHLWFVGAYTLCLVSVPLLHGLHERRPAMAMGGLVALCLAVEALRIAADRPWWGLLGFAPVWLAIHQIGFFRQDGSFRRASRGRLLAIAATAALAVAGLAALPWWGDDGLSTLNPPTLCMLALGVAQACALELVSPALQRLMSRRPVQAIAWAVGSRATTLYLWHLPVIVAVMAAWWLLGGPDPVPGSAQWWLWRLPLGVLCWVLILAAVRPLGAVEKLAGALAGRPAGSDGAGRNGSSSASAGRNGSSSASAGRDGTGSDGTGPSSRPRAWAGVLAAAALVVAAAILEVRFLLSLPLVLGGAAAMIAAVALLAPSTEQGPTGREPASEG